MAAAAVAAAARRAVVARVAAAAAARPVAQRHLQDPERVQRVLHLKPRKRMIYWSQHTVCLISRYPDHGIDTNHKHFVVSQHITFKS